MMYRVDQLIDQKEIKSLPFHLAFTLYFIAPTNQLAIPSILSIDANWLYL